jgi:hypothetical protein
LFCLRRKRDAKILINTTPVNRAYREKSLIENQVCAGFILLNGRAPGAATARAVKETYCRGSISHGAPTIYPRERHVPGKWQQYSSPCQGTKQLH